MGLGRSLLPWDTEVDPSRPLIANDSDIYHKMPFFKKLSKSQQETFTAHSTAQLLSQFLHGEQGALMTAACVTHSVPDEGAKLYAATQTMDEARHVEVYSKYCDKIALVYPMSPWLKTAHRRDAAVGPLREGDDRHAMRPRGPRARPSPAVYRTTTCPLLKQLTFNVMRDEGGVSFGHVFLGPVFKKMHPDDLEELADFAFQAVNILVKAQTSGTIANRVDPGFMQVLENSGIDADDFFKGLKEAADAGIAQDLPPGQVHALKDLMICGARPRGPADADGAREVRRSGHSRLDDIRVLQAMEGGHPTGNAA